MSILVGAATNDLIDRRYLSLKVGLMDKNRDRAKAAARRRVAWRPYAYIAPLVILLGAVYLVPLLDATRMSFTDARLFGHAGDWVGFANYQEMWSPEFGGVLLRTGVWLVLGVLGSMVLGTVMALLLDKPLRGRAVFRVLMTLPWIFPDAIAAIMWKFALHPGWGIINNLLLGLNLVEEPVNLLSTDSALWTVILIRIWKGAPFIFLVVLAGLQAIPKELDEAALVDGATSWQRLRYIKLPLLTPVLWASGTILAAWTLVIFDLVYVLTAGGPDGATEILAMRIYNQGFGSGQMGEASAISVLTIGLTALLGYYYVRREGKTGMA